MNGLQRQLWGEAGVAVEGAPQATAPRLYLESLNDMIDTHTARVGSLKNRVPGTVMLLQVVGSAVALGFLSLYLALLGRGLTTALVSAALVFLILYISFDLDRPHRGFITVPDSALEQARRIDGAAAGGRRALSPAGPPSEVAEAARLLLGHRHGDAGACRSGRSRRACRRAGSTARSRLTPWRTRMRWTGMSDDRRRSAVYAGTCQPRMRSRSARS